jgi:hypothetical protein
MSSATYQPSYQLTTGVTLLDHGLAGLMPDRRTGSYVADLDDGREYNEADALASSGDYFVALASRLDQLAQSLPRDGAEQIELEHIVSTLFYIQKHYAIVAKSKLRK